MRPRRINAAMLWALLAATAGCGHTAKSTPKDVDDDDPRRRRFVLIDAHRLPEAVVQRTSPKNLEPPTTAEIAQLRESLCDGLADPVIFLQLVVSHNWHYYWLCSERGAVRAMTPRGSTQLRQWLGKIEQRARTEQKACPAGSAKRMFTAAHASGITARAYCDTLLMLTFPDGDERSFTLGETPLVELLARSAPIEPASAGTPSPTPDPGQPGKAGCPPCPTKGGDAGKVCPPAKLKPNTIQACRRYGEKAFWQGVRKSCAKLCPAIFTKCNKLSPNNPLCHQLSEYCATLKGLCLRDK